MMILSGGGIHGCDSHVHIVYCPNGIRSYRHALTSPLRALFAELQRRVTPAASPALSWWRASSPDEIEQLPFWWTTAVPVITETRASAPSRVT